MINSSVSPRASRRQLTRVLSVAVVSTGLILSAAVPAAMASSSYQQGCFTITPTVGLTTQTVYGYNNCSYKTGFRVIDQVPGFAYTYEPCVDVAPYTTGGWKWTKGRKFITTQLCD